MECQRCKIVPVYKNGLCIRCFRFVKGKRAYKDRQKAPYGSQKRHPLLRTYRKMLDRCYSKNCTAYKNYGGRGIRVDKRWRGVSGFNNFVIDMGVKPVAMSLDRIDNAKDYSPDNCQWSTKKQQARNRRTNRVIQAFGKSQILIEWSEETGIKRETITMRLKLGWTPERALSTTPKKTARKY